MKNNYDVFAEYYDDFMTEKATKFFVETYIRLIKEKSSFGNDLNNKSLLELGCGTGSLLVYFKKIFKNVTGLERSKNMLKFAKKKLPDVKFVNADMVNFSLNERYDVIIIAYDTINHILNEDDWCQTFNNVYNHLNEGGVFLFDCNTQEKLSFMADNARPGIKRSKNGYIVMDVVYEAPIYKYKLFFINKNKKYTLKTEDIGEIAVSKLKTKKMLGLFKKIYIDEWKGDLPSKKTERMFFLCMK